MDWQVRIERKAQKELKKIPDPYKTKITACIDDLSSQPRPHNCKKLKGSSDLWRVRVGPYLIVNHIKENQLLILVVRIAHRSDVYRGL